MNHNSGEQEHRMTLQFQLLNRGLAVLVFIAASITSSVASAGTVVNVADVEQLYDAVNDTANAGAAVVLAPGIYPCRARIRRALPDRTPVVLSCRRICRFTELRAILRPS
jgi:hypothetical protein